jgi:hypothetical protein
MRARLLLAFALLALLAVLATRGAGRAVAPMDPDHPRPVSSPPSTTMPAPIALDSVRDPFRYGDVPTPVPTVRSALKTPTPPTPTTPPEPAFRVVGVVRREGRLVAALAIGGEVVLLAPGESAGGVTVLAVLEDGIRLRGPDGRDEVVPQP